MGTTAWHYEGGSWTDATSEWTSNDDWGWREELRNNGYEIEPAVRLGDIDTDSLAAEVYGADADDKQGWAVVLTVGDGGDVVLVRKMPDLLDFLNELSPVVDRVLGMNNGAQNATEREYARLRGLGYPHDVADEASRTFAAEVADFDDDRGGSDDDDDDDERGELIDTDDADLDDDDADLDDGTLDDDSTADDALDDEDDSTSEVDLPDEDDAGPAHKRDTGRRGLFRR